MMMMMQQMNEGDQMSQSFIVSQLNFKPALISPANPTNRKNAKRPFNFNDQQVHEQSEGGLSIDSSDANNEHEYGYEDNGGGYSRDQQIFENSMMMMNQT